MYRPIYKASAPTLYDGQEVSGYVDINGNVKTMPVANIDTGALINVSNVGVGSAQSADQTNLSGRGVKVAINITVITGTSPTFTVTIQGKDTTSGNYYTILTSAALNATGLTILTVYPGLTAAANVTASDVLPRTWRVTSTVAGTGPNVSATVSAQVIE